MKKLFGKAEDKSDSEYPGSHGVKKLDTEETPQQILSEDYPENQWPISGGWGYTKEDAVIINLDNEWEGVKLEYQFLEHRSYEEAIIFRPKEMRLSGLHFKKGIQALIKGNDGKSYDRVNMTVFAFTVDDFKMLKNDFESHQGFKDDPEGFKQHLKLAESKRFQYDVAGWFDITNFFGKR